MLYDITYQILHFEIEHIPCCCIEMNSHHRRFRNLYLNLYILHLNFIKYYLSSAALNHSNGAALVKRGLHNAEESEYEI